jgi:hypothetical protein
MADDGWTLVYEGFEPTQEGLREALCTLGNGYFATRAAAEEVEADGIHYPGTYLAGGYNRLATDIAGRTIENEDLVKPCNWLPLTFRPESGGWLNLRRVEVLDAFRASSRKALIRMDEGLTALNAVKELMADRGRPRDNLYEVALWEDLVTVQGDEVFYADMVDNQAIVVPETIDAIRALADRERDVTASMVETDAALGIHSPCCDRPAFERNSAETRPGPP